MADIEFRTREASCIADGLTASARRSISIRVAMMLRDDEKPRYTEDRRISSVYDTIKYVECSKGEAVERTLCSNMRRQENCNEECEKRVDVHGELERREVQASQKGKEAIEARDFIEEEG